MMSFQSNIYFEDTSPSIAYTFTFWRGTKLQNKTYVCDFHFKICFWQMLSAKFFGIRH